MIRQRKLFTGILGGEDAWARSINPAYSDNLLTNGDFETGDPPTGWSAQNGATLSAVADPRTGSAGTKALSVVNGAANYGYAKQALTISAGVLTLMIGWGKRQSGGNALFRATGLTNFIDIIVGNPATWRKFYAVGRNDKDNPYVGVWRDNTTIGSEARADDLEFYAAPLSSCLRTPRRTPTGDFVVRQKLRIIAGTWSGFALNLDNNTAPTNFVQAFVDGTNAYLDTCVNGTYTRYSTASAWSDDDELKVTKTGTTYTIYRNGIQLGDPQTINQATINNNTLHMQFSTYGGNLFTSPFLVSEYSAPTQITFTFMGDSITALTPSWADEAVMKYPVRSNIVKVWNNYASAGAAITHRDGYSDLADMVSLAAEDDANFVIIELGTNNDNAAEAQAAILAEMEAQIDNLKASNTNAQIFWVNVLPRFDGPPYEDKSNVRATIQTGCTAKGVTCLNTYDPPIIVQADTTDNLHLAASGKTKLAAFVSGSIP